MGRPLHRHPASCGSRCIALPPARARRGAAPPRDAASATPEAAPC